jgi:hypothetical protein
MTMVKNALMVLNTMIESFLLITVHVQMKRLWVRLMQLLLLLLLMLMLMMRNYEIVLLLPLLLLMT